MTTKKTNAIKTYEAKMPDGRTVRCTVPESDNREWPELLAEAIRETLSPEAVAAIVAYLQPAKTNDESVNRELGWFALELVDLLGGYDEQSQLAEELGL